MNLKTIPILLLSILLCSCTTKFFGNAHIDRVDCQKKCESWNMDLSGMVAMGEYSSGCVCRERSKNSSKVESLENSLGAVSAAGVAVVTLMEEEESAEHQTQH